ncbi:hypothetical protein CLOM_g21725 [Closterium sp. NIES-68]|nr:hypothetical protein CLOM_g21725 [Closterium sp. NIES-68]
MPVDADFRSCARQCEDTYRNTRAYQFDHADDYSEDSSISDGYDDGEDVEDDDDDDIGGSSNEETDLEDLYRAWLSSPLPSSWRTRPLKREISADSAPPAEHRGNFTVAERVESAPLAAIRPATAPLPPNLASASASASPAPFPVRLDPPPPPLSPPVGKAVPNETNHLQRPL